MATLSINAQTSVKLDPSFGSGGRQQIDVAGYVDGARSVVVQADGKIIVAGLAMTSPANTQRDFGLVRLNTDGTLDTSFGVNGRVTTDFYGTADSITDIRVQPDGKIIAVGTSLNAHHNDFALARYNSDGSLDGSFGTAGKVTTDFSGSVDEATAVLLLPDGKILVVGNTKAPLNTQDVALARYNPNGTLDNTFDADGKLVVDLLALDNIFTALLQPDGKIIVAGGSTATSNNRNFSLARFNPDGTLDTSFDGDGKVTTNADGAALGVSVRADGKILVVGEAVTIALYKIDGALDSSFGVNGIVKSFFENYEFIFDVKFQPDGKIIVASTLSNYTDGALSDFLIERFVDGVSSNLAPTVSITAPYSEQLFAPQANITIDAAAADSDGTISKVEFFANDSKIGEDATAPYSFTWSGVATGNYKLSAVATDNSGATSVSRTVKVPVRAALGGNDMFANAEIIADCAGNVFGSNLSATKEPGEPRHAGNMGIGSIWYKWTAPTTGKITFSTLGTNALFNTLLAVYTGANVNALTPVAQNDNAPATFTSLYQASFLEFNATAGTVYWIAVDTYRLTSSDNPVRGNISLTWKCSGATSTIPTLRFEQTIFATINGQPVYPIDENTAAGEVRVIITRTGNTSQASSVEYKTGDYIQQLFNCNPTTDTSGIYRSYATSRCDYSTTVGTLNFAAGETSKTVLN